MVIRLFLSLLAFSLLVSCGSKPVNIIGVDNPEFPAASVPGAETEVVYVATSRAMVSDPTVLYGSGRVLSGLNYFRVEVSIPPSHQSGYIERAKRVPPDPRSDFTILDPVIYPDERSFTKAVDRQLADQPSGDRDIMLFVHGFNTDLVLAILRAAQLKRDSGFTGIPVVFAWPSLGKITGYVYDTNSALQSRDWLIETADNLSNTRTEGMNIIAHSMGNLLTVEAMRQDQLLKDFNSSNKLKSIILAAPDIDIDLFKRQMSVFPKDQRHFYVLISEDDKALGLSRRLAGGVNRVGIDSVEDLAELGVTVIDLTNIEDTSSIDHSKFADSPEVVQLIGKHLNEGDSITNKPSTVSSGVSAAAEVVTGASDGLIAIFN
jgi:esterase/lipase superfamily enzyme